MSKRMMATLTAEHLVVLEMADKLRDNLEKLKTDQDFGAVQDGLMEFSTLLEHTVNQHFLQEDEELFPKMVKSHPELRNEVKGLQQEHQEIAYSHNSLRQELLGQEPSLEAVIALGGALADQLDLHLRREHEILANKKR